MKKALLNMKLIVRVLWGNCSSPVLVCIIYLIFKAPAHVYSHALHLLPWFRHAVFSGVPQQLQPRIWSSVQCLRTQDLCPDWGTWLLHSCIPNMYPRDWHTGTHTCIKLHTHTHPIGTPRSRVPQTQVWTLCCPDTLSQTQAPMVDRFPSLTFASRDTSTPKVNSIW